MARNARLVSVVVPNYNYAPYVGAAIESVLTQTYANVEVIVVDDGSTDGSLDVIARYGSNCRIIAQDNRGQSAARNRGIHEARGDFVAFLDADDLWKPQKLERQMECFARDPSVALVYCSVELVDQELQPTGRVVASARGDALRDFVRWPGRAVVAGGESTAVVDRVALDAVGRFDPSLSISAGWDLWRRIASRYPIDFAAEDLVVVRLHSSNASRSLRHYEADVRAASSRMFSDPASRRVHGFRKSYEAELDLMFARSWLREGDLRRGATLLMRGIIRRVLAPRRMLS